MAGDFLVTFVMALVFITFAISIAFIFKLTDLIARGVPWQPIVKLFLYSLPTSIIMSVPLGSLVSCLLVYGRMSDDGEVMAMQTLGISKGRIVRSTVGATLLLVLGSLLVNHEIEPRAHLARKTLQAQLHAISPLDVIEEGRFFRAIPGLTMYVGRKKGQELRNVRIYDARDPDFVREVHAKRGRVLEISGGRDLRMSLNEVRISPFSRDVPRPVYLDAWSLEIKDLGRMREYRKDEDDMGFVELLHNLFNVRAVYPYLDETGYTTQHMLIAFELNRRTAMAFSCLALVLVGIPLGIRSHRKSTGAGVALSLVIFMAFYLMTLLAQSLDRVPAARPDLIIWVPVVVFSGVGMWLLRRRG